MAKPKLMTGTCLVVALAAFAWLDMVVVIATTSHVVGGSSTGWTVPPNASFYAQWASAETFAIGDTLVFNFEAGRHEVTEVPELSYNMCSTMNSIGAPITTSPATVSIQATGNHYYICGVPGHCSLGQKLNISVSSSATPGAPGGGSGTSSAHPSWYLTSLATAALLSTTLAFLV